MPAKKLIVRLMKMMTDKCTDFLILHLCKHIRNCNKYEGKCGHQSSTVTYVVAKEIDLELQIIILRAMGLNENHIVRHK